MWTVVTTSGPTFIGLWPEETASFPLRPFPFSRSVPLPPWQAKQFDVCIVDGSITSEDGAYAHFALWWKDGRWRGWPARSTWPWRDGAYAHYSPILLATSFPSNAYCRGLLTCGPALLVHFLSLPPRYVMSPAWPASGEAIATSINEGEKETKGKGKGLHLFPPNLRVKLSFVSSLRPKTRS